MSSWLLALLASSQVPYELLALVFVFCFPLPTISAYFLETGKGLTCAVFTESVDLRPD